jgi:uncharacterized membrane protein YbhN (UPF0104 family)
VTAALATLAFVGFSSAIVCGVQALVDDDGHALWLRFGAGLAATAALAAWTFVRLRASRGVNQAPALPPAPLPGAGTRPRHRWLRRAGWLATAALLAAGAVSVAGEWDSVRAALGHLTHLHWFAVKWAIYAEALSVLALALLTSILLRAGGRRLSLGQVLGLTLAGNALSSSVPAGPAWAATFSFAQLRRRGVSRRIAAWVLAMSTALSVTALVALLAVGAIVAGGRGPAAALWPLSVILAAGLAVALPVLAAVVRRSGWLARITSLRPRRRDLAGAFAAASLGWIADCLCLVASIMAVSGRVPWQGLLAVYALTQVSQALPFTPGGVGVVEGTASLLLIAYGMAPATALAAVLLYRIISFWAILPIGWGAAGGLLAYGRRRRYAPIRVSSSTGLARSYAGSSSA